MTVQGLLYKRYAWLCLYVGVEFKVFCLKSKEYELALAQLSFFCLSVRSLQRYQHIPGVLGKYYGTLAIPPGGGVFLLPLSIVPIGLNSVFKKVIGSCFFLSPFVVFCV